MRRRPALRHRGYVVALAAVVALARPLAAQSASMAVTTTVSAVLISVAGLTPLQFGAVVPGTPTTIDPRRSANAGKFEIQGQRGAQFNFAFTLPTELRAGAGPYAMPLTYGNRAACQRNRDAQGGCQYFDPAQVLQQRIRNRNAPNNVYYVWIGGTVSPAASQHPGVYTATVTATVAYTGN